ncbi:MAG: FtsB family cell division protein [Acidimicrobiales bacterium]
MAVVALLTGVFPTRTWLAQRDAVAGQQTRAEVLAKENARLEQRVEQLHTDAEVERLAREQYHMVRPGEEAYAILPAPEEPSAEAVEAEPIANVRADGDHRPAWRKVIDLLTFWD